jgi:hypothetical protein
MSKAMGHLPSFGDHDFVTREQVDIIRPVEMVTKKQETDMMQIPRTLLECFTEALCYAA